jgi:pSer/pThr/pTyr-binding forkhead associated (FHA) protein
MDNKKFYTVEIPKPPKPYIVIELMRKNTSTKGKVFHFISFGEKKKVSLGRRKDVDVRIADDISISRVHASIEYDEEKKSFILTDNKSKFGTLALVKKGVKLKPKFNGISFQIGAEVFAFETAGQSNYEDDNEYLVKDESEI